MTVKLLLCTDGSFGESFYGLRRESETESASDTTTRLDDKSRLRSLMWLTAIPYLFFKIEQKLETYRLQLADGILFDVSIIRFKINIRCILL